MNEYLHASNARVLREISRTLESYASQLPDGEGVSFIRRLSAAIVERSAQLSFDADGLASEVETLREQNRMFTDEKNRIALHSFAAKQLQ